MVDLQIWIPELSLMSNLSQAAQVPENFTDNAKPKNFRLRKAYAIVLKKKLGYVRPTQVHLKKIMLCNAYFEKKFGYVRLLQTSFNVALTVQS